MEDVMGEHRLGRPATVGDTTIIPLLRVTCCADTLGAGISLVGAMEPVAVVVVTSGVVKALDVQAREMSLEEIHTMAPDLRDRLERRLLELSAP